jgi:hypothetical protein
LDERVITMLELEGDDSFIAQKQREDSKDKIKSITPKMMEYRLPFIRILAVAALAVYSIVMIPLAHNKAVSKMGPPPPSFGGNPLDNVSDKDALIKDLIVKLEDLVDEYSLSPDHDPDALAQMYLILADLNKDVASESVTSKKMELVNNAAKEIIELLKKKSEEKDKELEEKEKEMQELLDQLADKMDDLKEVSDELKEAMDQAIEDMKDAETMDEKQTALDAIQDALDQMVAEDTQNADQATLDDMQEIVDALDQNVQDQQELQDAKDALDQLAQDVDDALKEADDQWQQQQQDETGKSDSKTETEPVLPNANTGDGENGEGGKGNTPSSGDNVLDGNTPYADDETWQSNYEKAMNNPDLTNEERQLLQDYFNSIRPRG